MLRLKSSDQDIWSLRAKALMERINGILSVLDVNAAANPFHALFSRQFISLERCEALVYSIGPSAADPGDELNRSIAVDCTTSIQSMLDALPGYRSFKRYAQSDSTWEQFMYVAMLMEVDVAEWSEPPRAVELLAGPWPRDRVAEQTLELNELIAQGRYGVALGRPGCLRECSDMSIGYWDAKAFGCGPLEGAIRLGAADAASALIRAGASALEAPTRMFRELQVSDMLDLAETYIDNPAKLSLLRQASMEQVVSSTLSSSPASAQSNSTQRPRRAHL